MSEQPLEHCEFDAAELLLRLDITLAADLEEVRSLIDRIMKAVTEMGCARGKEHDVRLAIDEALTNAVVHGCKQDPEKKVQCCVACDDRRGILIIIRDPGPGFDPASIPSPTIGENLFATHGRGIFLINQIADEVRFERGGTEIHMRIR
jgi:serine/threonine-protein kinase RsbW